VDVAEEAREFRRYTLNKYANSARAAYRPIMTRSTAHNKACTLHRYVYRLIAAYRPTFLLVGLTYSVYSAVFELPRERVGKLNI